MLSSRPWGLAGLALLYVAVTAALFLRPEAAPALFPAYLLVFLAADYLREDELPVLLAFIILLVAPYAARETPTVAGRVAVLLEAAGVLTLAFGVFGRRRGEEGRLRLAFQVEKTALEQKIRDRERDIQFYDRFRANLEGQIRLRGDFSEAARVLACSEQASDVRSRLTAYLQREFPEAVCELHAGPPRDALEGQSAEAGQALLIPDSMADGRLRALPPAGSPRCLIVAPFKVGGEQAGFLRVGHPEPGRLQAGDLRAAELYAALGGACLDNAVLRDRVRRLALRDEATGLGTARRLAERLEEEVRQAGRAGTSLAVLLIQPAPGETFGKTAALVASLAREVDTAAHHGDGEAAVLLPNAGPAEVKAFVKELRDWSAPGLKTGAAFFPEDATTPSQLLRRAEERLRGAKAA